MAGDEGFYTAAEAARILRLSSQRVRQLLASGALRGVRDEVGHWEVDPRSIRETLDERREVLFGTLEHERERADVERKRVETLQVETERLREQLAEARAVESSPAEDSRLWWQRFFGFR